MLMFEKFSNEFKLFAIQKLLNRGSRSVREVTKELGISQSAAYSWIQIGKMGPMKNNLQESRGKRTQDYSGEQKFEAVIEFRRLKLDPEHQGEFLRKQGLHGPVIETWEKEVLKALEGADRRIKRSAEEIAKDNKITLLERDLRRKNKALAETTALLILKKKAESIWGLVDDEEGT